MKVDGYKLNRDTLYFCLEYLEDAFLILPVPLFTESLRKMQSNPKKIYVVDNGLICANRLGITLKLGNLFENQLYLDLRRQGNKIHYYKTSKGYEIDFVIETPEGKLELIQAAWDTNEPQTLAREERALKAVEKELGIKGRIIGPRTYLENLLTG